MYLPTLFGMFVLMIFLEALTDGLVYLGWTKWKVIYGILNHLTQILLLISVFLFGYWYEWELWSIQTLWTGAGYLMFRFGLFDLIYGWVSGNNKVGKSDIFDILIRKLGLWETWQHATIRLLLVFGAIILMIYMVK